MTQSLHWEGFSFSLLFLLVCQLAQPSRGCAEMLAPCWGSSAQCQAAHSAWLFGDPPCTPRSSPGMPHHTTPSFPATLNVVPVFVFFFVFRMLGSSLRESLLQFHCGQRGGSVWLLIKRAFRRDHQSRIY